MSDKTYAFLNTMTGNIDVHRDHCHDIGMMRGRGWLNSEWRVDAGNAHLAVAEERERFEAEGISGLTFRIMSCAVHTAKSDLVPATRARYSPDSDHFREV